MMTLLRKLQLVTNTRKKLIRESEQKYIINIQLSQKKTFLRLCCKLSIYLPSRSILRVSSSH